MDLDLVSDIYDKEIVPIWGRPFSDILRKYMPLPLSGTVLEVGCGTGYLSIELAHFLAEGARIIGLEPFLELVELAFQKAETPELQKKVFFQHHSLDKFNFAEGVFSSVYSNLALFYVDRPEPLIRSLLRVLKHQGKGYFTLPLRGSFHSFFSMTKEYLYHRKEEGLARHIENLELEFPTPEEVLYLFDRVGFRELALNVTPFKMIFHDADFLLDSPFMKVHFFKEWRPYLQDISFEQFSLEMKVWLSEQMSSKGFAFDIQAGCVQGTK